MTATLGHDPVRIYSPLTGSTNVAVEKEIRCDFLIEIYREQLNVDVTEYYNGLESIGIYKCGDTGFRFYYPFYVSGDEKFYEKLQTMPWYYMDWKWEHELAAGIIRRGNKLLEIGCARGSFLERMQNEGIESLGLEFSKSAIAAASGNTPKILNQSIEEHAKQNPEKYDVVCSFQVVEHISAVKEFIQAAVHALKPGGTLIITVPNNDSLVFECHDDIVLNMPPHHMGLWNINSLINIQTIFGIRLKRIELEPLQLYHAGFATAFVQRELTLSLYEKYGVFAQIIDKPGRRFVAYTVSKLLKHIIGQTIFVQYMKV